MAIARLDLLKGEVNFGYLTVVGDGERYVSPAGMNSYPRFTCRCVCGAERLFSVAQLTSGKRTSCGCMSVSAKHGRTHKELDFSTLPKTNKEAASRGVRLYFTGEPCIHGHISPRWVSNQWCAECARLSATAYNHGLEPRLFWARGSWKGASKSAFRKGVPFSLSLADVRSLCTDFCPALGMRLDYSRKGRICDASPTLDRIRPPLGYVMGNVIVISHQANRIKNNANAAQIQMVADWLRSLG
jgi:hypothetical protein